MSVNFSDGRVNYGFREPFDLENIQTGLLCSRNQAERGRRQDREMSILLAATAPPTLIPRALAGAAVAELDASVWLELVDVWQAGV
jgi:hypothetical protein